MGVLIWWLKCPLRFARVMPDVNLTTSFCGKNQSILLTSNECVFLLMLMLSTLTAGNALIYWSVKISSKQKLRLEERLYRDTKFPHGYFSYQKFPNFFPVQEGRKIEEVKVWSLRLSRDLESLLIFEWEASLYFDRLSHLLALSTRP